MVISSQAPQECGEGSTTREYNPERIMGPHERATVKICSKCKTGQAHRKTCPWCDACMNAHTREKRKNNPEFRARAIARSRAYYKANKDRLLAQKVEYGKKVNERDKARRRERYKADPAFRAKTAVRTSGYYERNAHMFRARDAKRRADQLRATPPWADLKAIREVYKEAKRVTLATGIPHEVDHIVPLKGRKVSGLHVHFNLQVIPMLDNRRKFNHY